MLCNASYYITCFPQHWTGVWMPMLLVAWEPLTMPTCCCNCSFSVFNVCTCLRNSSNSVSIVNYEKNVHLRIKSHLPKTTGLTPVFVSCRFAAWNRTPTHKTKNHSRLITPKNKCRVNNIQINPNPFLHS